ncbi:MAG TPA: TlpA disulfide reductase family protein [Planctomycetota bacterium]|nr:TlpA disulfide reductase family protein [Planctomycetota bacterium]
MRLSALTVALLLICSMFATSAWSQAMPEFGASVTFSKGEEPVTIAGLRGKVAVVVFFQSWCPICNGWAPGLLKQLEKQYAGQPGYVLMAIKTDGGTPKKGKTFLAGKGANAERWIVASDAEEAYYQRIIADAPLWGYAVVGPDGSRVEAAQAGVFYSKPGAKEFVLPSKRKEFDKTFADTKRSVLPAGKTYAPELSRAVQLAESGRLASAVATARSAGGIPGKELETDLLALLKTRLETLETQARDAANAERYEAFMALRDLTTQIKGLPPAKEAQKAVAEIGKDKAIQKEQKAENAWRGLMLAVEKQPKEKRQETVKASVPGFIKAYEGSHFARIAAETIAP